MTDVVHIDFETGSWVDISQGAYKYAESPTTRVYCAGYAFDAEPVRAWTPWTGNVDRISKIPFLDFKFERDRMTCPPDLRERVMGGAFIAAHYAFFERCIWELYLSRWFGWPVPRPEQWICSMAAAKQFHLSGKLKDCAKRLGLAQQKADSAVMKRWAEPQAEFCWYGTGNPWGSSEAEYPAQIEYCKQDVVVEREVLKACPPITPAERKIWLFDQRLNWRGVPIDVDLAKAGAEAVDAIIATSGDRLTALTGGEITKPTQVQRMLPWVNMKLGLKLKSLAADVIDELLAGDLPDDVAELLRIRRRSGSALAKYAAFSARACSDGRLHGELRYYGSHTGRWSAKGVQLQNLAKKRVPPDLAESYIPRIIAGDWTSIPDIEDVLTTLTRGVITAPPGYVFIDVDFNAIEARVIAWMAGEESLLRYFRDGGDPYSDIAAEIFQVPLASITKAQRALGKVAILGLGYGMGADTFVRTCRSWGVSVTAELASRAVTVFRKRYPKIVQFWYGLEQAILKAYRVGSVRWNRYAIRYDRTKRVLKIQIPSGRTLYYTNFRVSDKGEIKYYGKIKSAWSDHTRSWGGKFTENIDQGLSRDLLASAMMRIEAGVPGVEVVLTVHDELLMLAHDRAAGALYDEIRQEIRKVPTWAAGLPVDGDGWIGKRFRKAD
jgi:DNA polymerase bacteriophage-type